MSNSSLSIISKLAMVRNIYANNPQIMQESEDDLNRKIAFRSGIGTDKIDFAIVDNKTNLVTQIYVGYADTSKNRTAEKLGYSDHYTVGIGSTYRGTMGDIPNQCLVGSGWKYTELGGFFDPVDYTEIWTKDFIEKRDLLLLGSDWTQLADAPLSSSKKTEWATYRQALRDLPANTTDIQNPLWPTKPS